ncbi:tetratricopeptide repeat protein [Acaryochloris sp. IP29b_bin.148]|uniref:tetratricopeptide repeat protein n=1 Tax=Acaryochloris sp. IP29b_bin.148 TaxID=2969218 RepID=UPI0026046F7E|nr:tetratricopeptide repeat protein [Acaryochloris sp. IP29b_bin.148]
MKPSVEVPQSALDRLSTLIDQGLYLQAYRLSQSFGPLSAWQGPTAHIVAGRLAGNLGAPRLRALLHLRAWRNHPDDRDVLYYYINTIFSRQGPLAAYERLEQYQDRFKEFSLRQQAHWLSLRASVALYLRDFERAEADLDRAEALTPADPWLKVIRSWLYEREDRYSDALAVAQEALRIQPWYRAAVESAAHLHTLLNQDNQAIQLLSQATEQLESGDIWRQLGSIQVELGQYAQAQQTYEHYAQCSPLLEQARQASLWATQVEIAYRVGDLAQARRLAQNLDGQPCYQPLVDGLVNLPDGERVILPVGFVRQHHMTCAPATLTTLCAYWGESVDHHQIVETICYDGTSSYSERDWASQQGWSVCEFTVTWESTVLLINAGIPFTLSTVEATSAHLQAVIGYDSRFKTLIIRDPYERGIVECWADTFFEQYQTTGPRGMALVPAHKAGLLETLELPDSRLYDQLHQLRAALLEHDRSTATDWAQRMQGVAPKHRLALQAHLELAAYDSDKTSYLAVIDQMLALFPEDARLRLRKFSCLQEIASRQACLEWLEQSSDPDPPHPIFWTRQAELLCEDARADEVAIRLLRRSLRAMPTEAHNYYLLANIYWSQRKFSAALDLYRFATCLEDKNASYAHTYFLAARGCRQTAVALQHLKQRWQRDKQRSSRPAYTLAEAYEHLEQTPDAIAVLEQTQALHPEDGELLLYRAQYLAEHGQFLQAQKLLEEAKSKAAHSSWLRAAAQIAQDQCQPDVALELWQQVVAAHPLDMTANRAVSQLLAEYQDATIACDFLEQICHQFPHHAGLHELWYEQLQDSDPVVAEQVLRRLAEINPQDAWTWRQIAWQLGQQQQLESAFAAIETARQLVPHHHAYFSIYGYLCVLAGQIPAAKQAFQAAIQRSVDADWAISEWMALCHSTAEQIDVLDFIFQELQQQVITGDGLIAYRVQADNILAADELYQRLKEALEARPDLWHAWAAIVRQLLSMDQPTQALSVAVEAAERFPLLPRVWVDLAAVHRALEEGDAEEQALQAALALNPGWDYAVRQLADCYERAEALEQSKALLEKALLSSPLDAYNHGYLADVLWKLEEREAALQHLEKAIQLNPGYEWGWATLQEWSHVLERPQRPQALARALTVSRSKEARSWVLLAEHLTEDQDLDERLAALDQAIQLNPRCWDAYDLKARLLTAMERFEDAIASLNPTHLGDNVPISLAARAAWIDYQRGQIDPAIQAMQAIVTQEPDYYAGWSNLADWWVEQGNHEHYLAATEHLVRLAPDQPRSWGYRAEAKQKLGDLQGAKADFRQAFELEPEYSFAGLNLFDVALETHDLETAAQTLASLQEHHNNEFVLARTVQLAARQNDVETAAKGLAQLCVYPCEYEWALHTAVKTMVSANWTTQAQTILFDAFPQPNVNPKVGEYWVYCCFKLNQWQFCLKHLKKFHPKNPLHKQAFIRCARTLANPDTSSHLTALMQACRKALKADTDTWGIMGYALSTSQEYQQARKWLSDWQQRHDLKPWMLLNLVSSLWALQKIPKALTVSQYALTLPEDHSTPVHRLWLAFAASQSGHAARSRSYLDPIELQNLEAQYQFLYYLVEANLDLDLKKLPRHQRFKQAQRHIQLATETGIKYSSDRVWRTVFPKSIGRIANKNKSFKAYFWAIKQLLTQDVLIYWSIYFVTLLLILLYAFYGPNSAR